MRRTILISILLVASLNTPCAAVTKSPSAWQFEAETDVMSDTPSGRVFAMTASGAVVFRCDSPGPNHLYVMVVTKEFLGGQGVGYGQRDLLFRLDSDPPISAHAFYKDLTALLRPTEANVPAIYARAQTAHSLAVRALTYQAEAIDFSVSLEGLKAALTKLQGVCKDTEIQIPSRSGRAEAP